MDSVLAGTKTIARLDRRELAVAIRWNCIRISSSNHLASGIAWCCSSGMGGGPVGARRANCACQPQAGTALAAAGGPTHLYAQLQLPQLPAPLDQRHLHHLRSTRCVPPLGPHVHVSLEWHPTQPHPGQPDEERATAGSLPGACHSPAPRKGSSHRRPPGRRPRPSACRAPGQEVTGRLHVMLGVHAGIKVRKLAMSKMTAPCRTSLKSIPMLCSTHFDMKVAWRGALVVKLQQGS